MDDQNLIELPWEEISSWFEKGMVPWIKRHNPPQWAALLDLEEELNEISLSTDQEKIEGVLQRYKDLVFEIRGEYRTRNGKKKRSVEADGEDSIK
jgi:hypothetical protein